MTTLQKNILQTLAYFDVFSYPLSQQQVYAFLPRNSITIGQIGEELQQLVDIGIVQRHKDLYFVSDRTPDVVASRIENEHRALMLMNKARWTGLFLKQMPFIRAVFITGSVSKNAATLSSDVDFMIVTAPNRLWIAKMILTSVRRIFLLNSIKYFCFNLFVTEKRLAFPEQNIFNAIEIATTQVLWNETMHRQFQSENSWIKKYLPNWLAKEPSVHVLSNSPSPFQTIAEAVMNIFPMTKLDTFFMNVARSYWRKRNAHLDEGKFNSLFQCKPYISSVWYDDHQTHIMNKYLSKLAQLGVE